MSINDRIDHTILNADAIRDEIIEYCDDAKNCL